MLNTELVIATAALLGCIILSIVALTDPNPSDGPGEPIAKNTGVSEPTKPTLTRTKPLIDNDSLSLDADLFGDSGSAKVKEPERTSASTISANDMKLTDNSRPMTESSSILDDIKRIEGEKQSGLDSFEREAGSTQKKTNSQRDREVDSALAGLLNPNDLSVDSEQTSNRAKSNTTTIRSSDNTSTRVATANSTNAVHVVVAGDTLGKISQKYYGTSTYWERIQEENDNLDPLDLAVGMKLKIPGKPTGSVANAVTGDVQTSVGQKKYRVRKGDNYYVIAQRELGDAERWRELQDLNDIDAYELMPGMTIVIPERRGVRPSSSNRASSRSIPAGSKVHVVAEGDMLGFISQKYYGTTRHWQKIKQANNISDEAGLVVGQKLIIPEIAGTSSRSSNVSSRNNSSSSAPTGSLTYTVRPGDTLVEISRKFYKTTTRADDLMKVNGIKDAGRLRVGQKIKIPGVNESSSPVQRVEPTMRSRNPSNVNTRANSSRLNGRSAADSTNSRADETNASEAAALEEMLLGN